MLADIGTKPLQASRMAYLKKGLNMGKLEIEVEEKNEGEDEGEKKGSSTEDVERILKMIVCMAMVQGAEAQGEGSEGWAWELRVVAMVVLLALVGVVVVVAQVAKTIKGWVKKPEPEEEPQEEPREPITPRTIPREPTSQTHTPEPQIRERRFTYVVRTPQSGRGPRSPGYGETPRTISERSTPVRSRAFRPSR